MAKFTDEMFNSTGTATAITALTDYSITFDGKLLKVKIHLAGEAATSLLQRLKIVLSCKIWGGRQIVMYANGAGILTAPAVPILPTEQAVDLPVKTGVPITGTYSWNVTATTPQVSILGEFEG